jgi:hypothetical protein
MILTKKRLLWFFCLFPVLTILISSFFDPGFETRVFDYICLSIAVIALIVSIIHTQIGKEKINFWGVVLVLLYGLALYFAIRWLN